MFHRGQLHWCGDLGHDLATFEKDPQESFCGPKHKSETGAHNRKHTNQCVRGKVSRRGPSATHSPVSSRSLPPLSFQVSASIMPNAFMPLDFNDAEFLCTIAATEPPRPWAPIATRAICPSTRGNIHGVERSLAVGAACRTNMLAALQQRQSSHGPHCAAASHL